MNARRIAAPACLLMALAAISAPLGALEVTNGLVKLTLHEGIGRFSLAGVAPGTGASYTPLLVAQDPRSSMVSLLVADRVIRLGESSDYREAVEKTESGARFTWTSKQLVVTETFSFIGAPGSDVASGVRVDLRVANVSAQDLSVAVRYLFDTWLGEASAVHFRTDTVNGLSRELTVTKEERPAYWVSPLADDAEGFGLLCMLSGEGVTVPDRVVFANWKRLADAAWSYTTSAARTFSQAPYSLNDSAVGQYYDARPLPRGGSIDITLALGRASPQGLTLAKPAAVVATAEAAAEETAEAAAEETAEAAAEETAEAAAEETAEAAAEEMAEATAEETVEAAAEETAEAPAAAETAEATAETAEAAAEETVEAAAETAETAAAPPTGTDPIAEARIDLAGVNALLQEIDRLLAAGSPVTEEELAALEESLTALKERAALYGTGRD